MSSSLTEFSHNTSTFVSVTGSSGVSPRRLYLITSMSNPHYLPAVCIEVTIINFTVTFEGLQEQLLSSVVKQENAKLESQR